jgi:excisionase family DNA binding protein
VAPSPSAAGTDRQLKCREAAAKLGVCEKTLRRYIKAERIRYRRLPGGHFRIPESAIDEFFSEHDGRQHHQARRSTTRRRALTARPPAPAPASGRRPRLGCEPPQEYDLSPAALEALRAQFR